MPRTVLFIDEPHPLLAESLPGAGFDVRLAPDAPREELEHLVADCVGVVIKSRIELDADFFDHGPHLRFVARVGAGLDSIDLAAAAERGIEVLNSPEGNRDAVAEQCMGALLMLLNNLRTADQQMRDNIWQREPNRGRELKGMTVGIVGYGHMGRAFAQRLGGFGVRTIAYDTGKTGFSDDHATEVTFEELAAHADVVSFHIPWSPENDRLVDAAYLAAFARSPIIINTARGNVLVLDDLVAALEQGTVWGAAIDVFEYEDESFEAVDLTTWPPTYRRLCESDRVVLTPHIAGWTHASSRKHSETLFAKAVALDWS